MAKKKTEPTSAAIQGTREFRISIFRVVASVVILELAILTLFHSFTENFESLNFTGAGFYACAALMAAASSV